MIYVLKMDQLKDWLPTRVRLVGPFEDRIKAGEWNHANDGDLLVDLDYPVVLAYTPSAVANLLEMEKRLDPLPPVEDNRNALAVALRRAEDALHVNLTDVRWAMHRARQLRSFLGL